MVHLNELHDKYGEKGLTVLAVAKQDRSSVEDFVEEFEARYPTVVEKSDSMRAYGRTSFPSAVLIGSNGCILWLGHPGDLQDARIDQALEESKILPAWPEALKSAKRAFGKEKYADALSKVEKEIAKEKLAEDDAAAAEGIRDWILWYGTSTLEAVKQDVEGGKYYEASVNLQHVADLYKRHELAKQADAALKDLLSDPDRKLEVKAGDKLAKVLREIEEDDLKPKKALLKLRPLLGKKYAETAAGKRAAELAEKLEAELD